MSTVVIAGLGGLGCPAALSLAEGGVERLVLVDDDQVDISNLARQVLYTTEDIGRPKIEVAAERLRVIAPGIDLELVSGRVDADTVDDLLADADLILDATDDPGARFVINDAALAHRIPAVLGGIHRFEGLVLGIGPGFGPCFRCLFEDVPADDEVTTCAQAGVLGPIAGIVGHLQARRALGLLAGDLLDLSSLASLVLELALLLFASLAVRFARLALDVLCLATGLFLGLAARILFGARRSVLSLFRESLRLDR